MNPINRRKVLKASAAAGGIAAGILAFGPAQAQAQDNRRLRIVRLVAGQEACKGTEMQFLALTGSDSPPMVCLADNSGFPNVKELYAKGIVHPRRGRGVQVYIRFDGPARGQGLAVNLLQADIRDGNIAVVPLL